MILNSTFSIQSYAETVGLEGPFTSDKQRIGPRNFQYQIKLKGTLYNEVENAEIILSTTAEDRPKDFNFKVNYDDILSIVRRATRKYRGQGSNQ